MEHPSPDLLPYRIFRGQTTIFGYVMVALMMVTLGVGVAQMGERLVPGWNGSYLAAVALLISLEAFYTRKRVEDFDFREEVTFRVSEWIAIAVALKILIYLLRGPAQLLQDLPLWQADFFAAFFSGEYVVALFVALVVWFIGGSYAGELENLYNREQDALWDELGKLQNALHDIRSRFAARVFIIGAVVVLLAALSRIDVSGVTSAFASPAPGNGPIINVLAYFILALVMLSQTQFALLRTRWLWQRLPVSPRLSRNWLLYGLLFFAILAVVVFFLPTHYSIGLFDTLRYAFEYISQLFSFLLFIIMFPLTLCMSLFKVSQGNEPQPPQIEPPALPPQVAPSQPAAWLEFVRSLAFWVIFIGVILFALRYYLSQNATLWQAIVNFPLFRWMARAWHGLWDWLRGANKQISGLVRDGMKRLRAQRVTVPVQAVRRMFNLSRMNPREKIIYFYLSLIELGGERGLERRPSQTPYQYEQNIDSAVPEVEPDLHSLTETFLEARYSPHPVEEPKSAQASSLWERIKGILRGWKKE